MRLFLILPALILIESAPAFAHLGHFGDLAGHDHWIAAGALGAAIAVAGWAAWKGDKSKEEKAEAEEELPEGTQEA